MKPATKLTITFVSSVLSVLLYTGLLVAVAWVDLKKPVAQPCQPQTETVVLPGVPLIRTECGMPAAVIGGSYSGMVGSITCHNGLVPSEGDLWFLPEGVKDYEDILVPRENVYFIFPIGK